MRLFLADRFKENQYGPCGSPNWVTIGEPPNTQQIMKTHYKDPLDGRSYHMDHVRFGNHQLTLFSPWAIAQMIAGTHKEAFEHNKGFRILPESFPKSVRPSFVAMTTDQKRRFILLLLQKEYPGKDLLKMLADANPMMDSIHSGKAIEEINAEELAKIRKQLGSDEPAPPPEKQPQAEVVTDPEKLAAIIATGEAPPEKPPEIEIPVEPGPVMPEGHRELSDGKIQCCCGKLTAGPRYHKQHLQNSQGCYERYPDGFCPPPKSRFRRGAAA